MDNENKVKDNVLDEKPKHGKKEPLADEGENSKNKCKKKDAKESSGDARDAKKAEKLLDEKEKELEAVKAELSEQNDRHLRLLAEYDNYRKRTQAEKDAAYGYAVADAVDKILPVLDNLERSVAAAVDDTSPICEGVRMIERQFRESLEKLGVTEIPALGETFNPDVHNAVMHDEDEDKGENEIVEVFQKGYALGDKVIRHSMVKVVN